MMNCSSMTSFVLAGCQMAVTDDKERNHKEAQSMVQCAVEKHHAELVILPECWNCPYSNSAFPLFAEDLSNIENSPSAVVLRDLAKKYSIFLIGGSIPEKEGSSIYNTSLTFGPDGELLGKYRKMHLFDVNVPGKITFIESDTLSPGNEFTSIRTPWGEIGVGICFDVRFPEFTRYYQEKGCSMMVFPGAFNMTTGPAHWELLLRSRALDYQMYVCGVSPARDEDSSYVAWGHSSILSPWGTVLQKADHTSCIISSNIDLNAMHEIREQIPVSKQRRIFSSFSLAEN